MIRTIISLSVEDKIWLERRAHAQGLTMTELVRRSVALYRHATDPEYSESAALLQQTHGLWKDIDGLAYQEKLRDDWGARP